MTTEAVRLPTADGVNLTVIVQEPPAATELGERGQVVVSPKSPGLVPVIWMLATLRFAFPILFRVMVCAALGVPTF